MPVRPRAAVSCTVLRLVSGTCRAVGSRRGVAPRCLLSRGAHVLRGPCTCAQQRDTTPRRQQDGRRGCSGAVGRPTPVPLVGVLGYRWCVSGSVTSARCHVRRVLTHGICNVDALWVACVPRRAGNNIGEDGAAAIAESIKSCRSLCTLVLSCAFAGQSSACSPCVGPCCASRSNCSPRPDNNLGSGGSRALAKALPDMSRVVSLDLSCASDPARRPPCSQPSSRATTRVARRTCPVQTTKSALRARLHWLQRLRVARSWCP